MRGCRLVSEVVTSVPPQITDGVARQVRLSTTTKTEIEIGLNDIENPTEMQVQIAYTATLIVEETTKELATYTAKHAAQFRIADSMGIDDWTKPPEAAMAPIVLTLQMIALQRAESTFMEMGMKGVNLPNPILDKEGPALLPSKESKAASK